MSNASLCVGGGEGGGVGPGGGGCAADCGPLRFGHRRVGPQDWRRNLTDAAAAAADINKAATDVHRAAGIRMRPQQGTARGRQEQARSIAKADM